MDIRTHAPGSALLGLSLLAAALAPAAAAQSVVVDEGSFAITLQGREVGTETFAVRRSGLGDEATFIAHGVVELDLDEGRRELRPMLQTVPPVGVATGYQLKVAGTETAELNMTLAGRRYVSLLRSERGEEEREFLARDDTRVLDRWVAHQYYFVRDLREGESTWIIEPGSRRQYELRATASVEETVTVAGSSIPARRLTLQGGDAERVVWFDDQGRVLRVEIPARSYRAVRDDLPG